MKHLLRTCEVVKDPSAPDPKKPWAVRWSFFCQDRKYTEYFSGEAAAKMRRNAIRVTYQPDRRRMVVAC